MMVVERTLLDMGVSDREMCLFDTYEGMSAPTDVDRDHRGRSAMAYFEKTGTGDDSAADWIRATIEEVRANLGRTNYPTERLLLVKGKVEETIPGNTPGSIALHRLDTDWHGSTKHELEHLRKASGGRRIFQFSRHASVHASDRLSARLIMKV